MAALASDLPDYAPGSTAYLTATGFTPGEAIQFQVLHIDGVPNTGNGHDPWTVVDGSVDDLDGTVDGNVLTSWYVDPDDSLGSTFEATAIGLVSGIDATTTFTDAGGTWSISRNSADKSEGDSGTRTFTFDVTLARTANGSTSVNWATASGTATGGSSCSSGVDFISDSGSVTYSSSSSGTQTISVVVCGDTTFESDEAFTVNLSSPTNGTVLSSSNRSATGTIRNDDAAPTVTVAASPSSVSESSGQTITYTFTRTGSTTNSLVADFTLGGSATKTTDYSIAGATTSGNSGTVTFAAGSSTATVTVTPVNDTTVEANETVSIALDGTGYTIGTPGTASGTITNDDQAVVSISAPSRDENSGPLTFSISLSNPVDTSIGMTFDTANGTATTADGDYTSRSNVSVSFPANSTSQSVNVTLTGDNKVELDETVRAILSSLNANGRNVVFSGNGSTLTGTGTIKNDDQAVVSISSPNDFENSSPITFQITLSNPIDTSVGMTFDTANGTATTADNDYVARSNVAVTFTAGSTSQSVNVTLNNDNKVELDETVRGILSALSANGRNIVFSGNGSSLTGTGTIGNDDRAVVSISSPSVDENSGPMTFNITLSNPVDTNVAMTLNTADGTATTADSDYTARSNVAVSFAAGTTSQSVNVTLTGDNKVERDETLRAILSSLNAGGRDVSFANNDGDSDHHDSNSTLTGTGTIENDDQSIVTISAPSVNENSGPLTFNISLSNPVDTSVSMTLNTGNGTATIADSDYTARSNVAVNFAAGTTSQSVNVTVTGDNKVELNETMNAVLNALNVNGRNVVFSGGGASLTGVGTIVNDDQAVVSITSPSANENAGPLTFNITLSNPVDVAVSMLLNTANGTATTADGDYTAVANSGVSFAAGSTSQSVNVTLSGDNKVELNETLSAVLSSLSVSGRNVVFSGGGSSLSGTGTITNDDQSVVTISSPTVAENSGPLTFNISLSNPVDTSVSMTLNTADGTATTADSDYTARTNTPVSFSAGSTSQSVNVTLTGDNKVELDETLSAILSSLNANGRNVILSGGGSTLPGMGTIVNDDSAVITISSPSAPEASGALSFVVTLSNPVDVPVSLVANTSDGTARTSDNDYVALANAGSTIPAGSTTGTIVVTIKDDFKVELNETTSTILSSLSSSGRAVTFSGSGATLTGVGTIVDDDATEFLVLGADANSTTGPYVEVIRKTGGSQLAKFQAYESTFTGGVRVAVGDVTGDGIPEIVTAPGRGRAPEIRVFTLDGIELTPYRTMAYASTMINGVQVALGDINGDGRLDIGVVPSRGAVEVRLFQNQTGLNLDPIPNTPTKSFVAFASTFTGGGVIAMADMGSRSGTAFASAANGSTLDKKAEVIVGSGPGMRATVNVYDVTAATPLLGRQILPFAATYVGGIGGMAVGKVNTVDCIPDLIVGVGSGGNSLVEVRSGANGALFSSFSAYSDASRQAPLRIAAHDSDRNGVLDQIWTSQGTDGKTRQVKKFSVTGTAVDSVLESDVNFRGEYFVG